MPQATTVKITIAVGPGSLITRIDGYTTPDPSSTGITLPEWIDLERQRHGFTWRVYSYRSVLENEPPTLEYVMEREG